MQPKRSFSQLAVLTLGVLILGTCGTSLPGPTPTSIRPTSTLAAVAPPLPPTTAPTMTPVPPAAHRIGDLVNGIIDGQEYSARALSSDWINGEDYTAWEGTAARGKPYTATGVFLAVGLQFYGETDEQHVEIAEIAVVSDNQSFRPAGMLYSLNADSRIVSAMVDISTSDFAINVYSTDGRIPILLMDKQTRMMEPGVAAMFVYSIDGNVELVFATSPESLREIEGVQYVLFDVPEGLDRLQLKITGFTPILLDQHSAPTSTSPTTSSPKSVSPETLLPKAASMCEAAFLSSISEDSLVLPVSVFLNIEYWDKLWHYAPSHVISDFEALSASEVQTVVCIKESRRRVGTYLDGVPAYRREWDTRLVRWPGGEVIGAMEWYGSDPAVPRDSSESNYGSPPSQELNEWLSSLQAEKMVLSHQDGSVSSIAFSPDGKILASADQSSDGFVARLWDVETGQELRTLGGHTRSVISVAFSPDGMTLASGGFDETVKLWDVATGLELRTLSGFTDDIEGVAFSPDGQTLAVTADDFVTLWDVTTGQQSRSLGYGRRFAFSPDGQILALGQRRKVELWDTANWTVLHTFVGEDLAFSLAFSWDGKILASGKWDGGTVLWDVGSGEVASILSDPEVTGASTVAFSPDGTLIAANGYWTVRLFDVATGQEVRTFRHALSPVNSIAFSPDGETLASGWSDGTVVLWDIATAP